MKTPSPTPSRSQEILAQIGRIPALVRGKLSPRHSRGKPTGHKLQRWREGRNETLHIPADKVEVVREATEGYRHFNELIEHYVDAREQEVLGVDLGSKKKPSRR